MRYKLTYVCTQLYAFINIIFSIPLLTARTILIAKINYRNRDSVKYTVDGKCISLSRHVPIMIIWTLAETFDLRVEVCSYFPHYAKLATEFKFKGYFASSRVDQTTQGRKSGIRIDADVIGDFAKVKGWWKKKNGRISESEEEVIADLR